MHSFWSRQSLVELLGWHPNWSTQISVKLGSFVITRINGIKNDLFLPCWGWTCLCTSGGWPSWWTARPPSFRSSSPNTPSRSSHEARSENSFVPVGLSGPLFLQWDQIGRCSKGHGGKFLSKLAQIFWNFSD